MFASAGSAYRKGQASWAVGLAKGEMLREEGRPGRAGEVALRPGRICDDGHTVPCGIFACVQHRAASSVCGSLNSRHRIAPTCQQQNQASVLHTRQASSTHTPYSRGTTFLTGRLPTALNKVQAMTPQTKSKPCVFRFPVQPKPMILRRRPL